MAYADTLLGGSVERLGRRLLLAVGSSVNIAVATLTGNVTCTTKTPMILRLDPNGSDRTVTLLTGADAKGECKLVHNAGSANTITLSYGSGPTTLATLAAGQWALIYSADGTTWYSLATSATFTSALTTTRGIASGTALKVGGRATSFTASSTTISGGAGAQAFDVKYTIPASSLGAGDVLHIAGQVKAIAQNATDTFTVTVKIGSTAIWTSSSTDIAANDRCVFDLWAGATAAAGAAVDCRYGGIGGWSTSGAGPTVAGGAGNLATNGALDVTVSITYGSSNSGNQSALEFFSVEVV
jgi:hypothetical protein